MFKAALIMPANRKKGFAEHLESHVFPYSDINPHCDTLTSEGTEFQYQKEKNNHNAQKLKCVMSMLPASPNQGWALRHHTHVLETRERLKELNCNEFLTQ